MADITATISFRTVNEWALWSDHFYHNPFADVAVDTTHRPGNWHFANSGLYDGDFTWRVHFNPYEVGP